MKNTNLQNRLKNIVDEYGEKDKNSDWLAGNFIPPEEKEKYRIMFIGKKPSDFFIKPQSKHLRYLGNYNATFIDIGFQGFLRRHNLGKVYVTDMVKTEGKVKVGFKKFREEWYSNDNFKECLTEEIDCYKPKLIGLMGGDVKNLFKKNLEELNIELSKVYFPFYHPSYLCRNPHASVNWDKQFEGILKQLK